MLRELDDLGKNVWSCKAVEQCGMGTVIRVTHIQ